jgi:glycosyltransferase involved in cell wall biosynthesis
VKVRIFGIPTETGVGTHSTNLYEALKRLNLDGVVVEFISKYDLPMLAAAVETSAADDINIFLFRVVDLSNILKGKKYFWYVFESTKPGLDPQMLLKEFDYLIAPSKWGRDCLIEYGAPSDKVIVIPEGVNIWNYHPYQKPVRQKEKTRFLMLGKYETRKGYGEAFAAFDEAIRTCPNIELWIKPDWINGLESFFVPEFKEEVDKYSHLPIALVHGILSVAELRQLYFSVDYFLFPSRCEAWGLPLIEAIACGTPAICAEFGGHSEYLADIPGGYIPIPYETFPVDCEKWKEGFPDGGNDFGKWAKINPSVLSSIIVSACDMDFSDQAAKSSKIIRSRYSWDQSAYLLADAIFSS